MAKKHVRFCLVKWIFACIGFMSVSFACNLQLVGQTATITNFNQTVNAVPKTTYVLVGDLLGVAPDVELGNNGNAQPAIIDFTSTWHREPGQMLNTSAWFIVLPPNLPPFNYSCMSIQPVLGPEDDWYSYDLKVDHGANTLVWQGVQFTKGGGGGGGGDPGIDD